MILSTTVLVSEVGWTITYLPAQDFYGWTSSGNGKSSIGPKCGWVMYLQLYILLGERQNSISNMMRVELANGSSFTLLTQWHGQTTLIAKVGLVWCSVKLEPRLSQFSASLSCFCFALQCPQWFWFICRNESSRRCIKWFAVKREAI